MDRVLKRLGLLVIVIFLAACAKSPSVYSVTLIDYGIENRTYSFKEGETIEIPTFIKTGHKFDGWYYDSEHTLPFTEKVMPKENITLYAKWTKETYIISFNSNGSNTLDDINLLYGDDLSLPTPTRDGYTFLGWYTSDNKSITKTTNISSNTTLFAKWERIQYTLSFDLVGFYPITFYHGEDATLPTPEKIGHTFLGWYTEDEQLITTTTNITKNETLYPKWDRNPYTITFEYETITPISFRYGDDITLPTPVMTGYTFLGWYTEEDQLITSTTTISNNESLYPKWEKTSYTITFDYPLIDPITFYQGEDVTLPTPENIGHTFLGWYTEEDQLITTTTTITKSESLYPKWDRNPYTITFESNIIAPITFRYGDDITLPTPIKTGYTFLGWYTEEEQLITSTTTISKNEFLYPKWERDTYTITFEYPVINPITFSFGDDIPLPTPVKTGHTFLGWYSNTDDLITSTTTVTSNLCVFPKWEATLYAITFETNGGDVIIPIEYEYGETIDLPVPFKTGNTFLGWYEDVNLSQPFSDVVMGDNGVKLYAKWFEGISEGLEYELLADNSYKVSYSGLETGIYIPETYNGLEVTVVGMFRFASNLERVYIPANVKIIDNSSFQLSDSLKTVIFAPNSKLEVIGEHAFRDCPNLVNFVAPEGLLYIEEYAFSFSTGLTSFYVPDSVIRIEGSAFYNASKLQYINIPKDTEIGSYAFVGTLGMVSFEVDSDNPYYKSVDGVLFNRSMTELISFPSSKQLIEYTVPDTVVTIKTGAFSKNQYLQTIILPEGLLTIERLAFDMSNIERLSIPQSVELIGPDAFYKTTKLEEITVDDNNNYYKSLDGVLYNKDMTILIKYPDAKTGTEFTIPSTVETITQSAFLNTVYLTNLSIPDSVKVIEFWAIQSPNLKVFTFTALVPPVLGFYSFPINTSFTIYVPGIALETYKTQYSNYKDYIYPIE